MNGIFLDVWRAVCYWNCSFERVLHIQGLLLVAFFYECALVKCNADYIERSEQGSFQVKGQAKEMIKILLKEKLLMECSKINP